MTDSLRDRIAAVIRREVPCHPPAADRIAREVIRELRLSQDRGVIIGCDGKCAKDECGCPYE